MDHDHRLPVRVRSSRHRRRCTARRLRTPAQLTIEAYWGVAGYVVGLLPAAIVTAVVYLAAGFETRDGVLGVTMWWWGAAVIGWWLRLWWRNRQAREELPSHVRAVLHHHDDGNGGSGVWDAHAHDGDHFHAVAEPGDLTDGPRAPRRDPGAQPRRSAGGAGGSCRELVADTPDRRVSGPVAVAARFDLAESPSSTPRSTPGRDRA